MKILLSFLLIAVALSIGEAFSKYGRSCKDIGCTNNEVCVLKEDPCSLYSRNNECGKYPTCQKVNNAAASCDTFVCPPTQICKMDSQQPRCYDDPDSAGKRENKRPVQSYNPGPPSPDAPSAPVNPNYPSNPNYPPPNYSNNYPANPSYPNPAIPQNYPGSPNYPAPNYPANPNYPSNPSAGLYPSIPSGGGAHGQTTSRPNVYQPGQHASGGGYQGGSVGSGYPGSNQGGYPRQGGGYPVQSGGYPSQGGGYPGYPSQSGGYPAQGGGYPGQGGGYPSQGGGYPSQGGAYPGYPSQQGGNYPKQQGGYYNPNQNSGGYPGYGNKPSGQDSNNPILDKITNTLKTIGLFWFTIRFVISRANSIFS